MSAIETLYNEWRSLKPLKESDQRRLDQKFMLEFNYNSNHIYSVVSGLFLFSEKRIESKRG